MDLWKVVLTPVLAVFAVMAVGAAARKVNWLTEEADKSLLKLIINILFPALIFHVILGNPTLRDVRTILVPPLVGFITIAGGLLLALGAATVGARAIGLADEAQRRTFALCVGIYNYVYIPLPLVAALFANDSTAAMLFIHNIGVELALWTVGVLVISGHVGRQWYKGIINVPSISIAIALVLNWLGVPLYARAAGNLPFLATLATAVGTALEMMGRTAVPLALLLVGATIIDHLKHTSVIAGKRVVLAGSLLRLGILPVMFLAIAYFLPLSLVSAQLKQVIAIQAAMPGAMFPIIMARHYGGHPPTALRIVLGTSLLSLLTTPLWLAAGKAIGIW